jgi:hypothetical protein
VVYEELLKSIRFLFIDYFVTRIEPIVGCCISLYFESSHLVPLVYMMKAPISYISPFGPSTYSLSHLVSRPICPLS